MNKYRCSAVIEITSGGTRNRR